VIDIVNELIPYSSGDISQIQNDIIDLQTTQGIQDGLISQNTNDIININLG